MPEQSGESLGLQARIRRQVLPRIRYDGLIEYSTPPVMDSFVLAESEMSSPSNADLAWIVSNGGIEPDPFERTMSPISLAGNLATIRRNRMAQQQKQTEKSSSPSLPVPQQPTQQPTQQPHRHQVSAEKSIEKSFEKAQSPEVPQKMIMTRMKSDDSFVRRQGSGE